MLGKRKSYYVENGIIHFAFEYGKGSLEVLTDNIVNVFVPFNVRNIVQKPSREKSQSIYILMCRKELTILRFGLQN